MKFVSHKEKNPNLEKIKTKFLDNQFLNLKPCWYQSWESIDNADIEEWRKPVYEKDILIQGVNLSKLMILQDESRKKKFEFRKMYHPRGYDDRTSSILSAWIHKIPLLPPHFAFYGKEKLLISDGFHRINAALCLNETTIPIIVYFGSQDIENIDFIQSIGEMQLK